jgi:hypothetical protein
MGGEIPRPIRRIRIGLYTGQYSSARPKRPKNSASGREYAKWDIFRGEGDFPSRHGQSGRSGAAESGEETVSYARGE